ncbi:MAG: UDP-N-acetylglucosamine 1-carboxyvinyltransferase [Holosporaceae bacterium]|nr:UDP-N-acetylglucosamine 1-carboxyvinyltransferase [Holosporaceae bacterium]
MVEKIKVPGSQTVNGTVWVSGAKNAALPLLAASLLSSDGMELRNVPPLLDIDTMLDLLTQLGVICSITKNSPWANSIKLKTDSLYNFTAPYEIVKKMRASILVLGPLLARLGRCCVSLPGGCAIGVRPIDLHLKGLKALGAEIDLKDGYVYAKAIKGLKGADFRFPIVTVTGTENIMMAATLADGVTVLENVAREPEVVDLANCLNSMGAKISGQGTDVIEIKGVSNLGGAKYSVIPDRIEAGSYAIAAGITEGRVDLIGGNFRNVLQSFIDKMEEIGLIFSDIENGIHVESSGKLLSTSVCTSPYPGFPTDLQAQTMSLLCLAEGESEITENIWENRFMHAAELMRMGASISVSGAKAHIKGVKQLTGASVMATDLRASFGLITAALSASGDTTIDRVYHIDRGYSCLEEKFKGCEITLERVKGG